MYHLICVSVFGVPFSALLSIFIPCVYHHTTALKIVKYHQFFFSVID